MICGIFLATSEYFFIFVSSSMHALTHKMRKMCAKVVFVYFWLSHDKFAKTHHSAGCIRDLMIGVRKMRKGANVCYTQTSSLCVS